MQCKAVVKVKLVLTIFKLKPLNSITRKLANIRLIFTLWKLKTTTRELAKTSNSELGPLANYYCV